MRKIMKRGFCLFLVAVLLAGLVPCAFADEAMPTGEVEASEAATEAAEETTAPPETAVPSESAEPPSETTEPPEATETTEPETEVTEPEADPVEDAPEDAVEDDRLAAYASTVTNVLLFDKASPNYTTVLRSQVSVTYNPNGSDAAKQPISKIWAGTLHGTTMFPMRTIRCTASNPARITQPALRATTWMRIWGYPAVAAPVAVMSGMPCPIPIARPSP